MFGVLDTDTDIYNMDDDDDEQQSVLVIKTCPSAAVVWLTYTCSPSTINAVTKIMDIYDYIMIVTFK